MDDYERPGRVDALPLIAETRVELLRVLRGLDDAQWQLPTACEGWSVKDVALHLLGDDFGLLSNLRDGDGQYHKVETWDDLVAFIDAQNDGWVRASRRISRRLLIDLLQFTGPQVVAALEALDPDDMAGPIGWAGIHPDPQWLHVAREFSEYWMHHQHICEAVGVTSLKDARYMLPLISTLVRALPQTYARTYEPPGTTLAVEIDGAGRWLLVREDPDWVLYLAAPHPPAATVALDADTAWRLFTHNQPVDVLRERIAIDGDVALGEVFLGATAYIG